jgi:hypothetical protein
VPVALDRWVRAAIGPPPFDVAPVVAVGAIALALVPVLWLGALKEVVPVTSADMVERLVPNTTTYVELHGLAMTVPFSAPGRIGPPPYGLLVRDTVASTDLTVVTTASDPRHLLVRTTIGRLVSRPFGEPAARHFSNRGEDVGGLEPRVLLEVTPDPDEEIVAATSTSELADVPDGSLVSVPLAFDGESVPICAIQGDCERGVLAAGTAIFLHLAHGHDGGGAILVQLGYPSSVVPGEWAGEQVHWSEPLDIGNLTINEFNEQHRQVRNGQALDAFSARRGVQALAGWGRILVQSSISHDPDLIRDRLWLGPILFTVFGGLLFIGLRLGYPDFRPDVGGSRRWTSGAPPAPPTPSAEPLAVVVSGHALKPGGDRWHLDEARGTIRAAGNHDDGRVTAAVHLADGTVIPLAAHDTGLLGHVERGSVVSLAGVRPALWAHWYGTDLRMTFESEADRDRAADLVSRGGAPLRSGA